LLNPSDLATGKWAINADIAQILRGTVAFGAVAFHEGAALGPEQVHVEPGYADCLPILGGGCWRDPDSPKTKETIR